MNTSMGGMLGRKGGPFYVERVLASRREARESLISIKSCLDAFEDGKGSIGVLRDKYLKIYGIANRVRNDVQLLWRHASCHPKLREEYELILNEVEQCLHYLDKFFYILDSDCFRSRIKELRYCQSSAFGHIDMAYFSLSEVKTLGEPDSGGN